VIDNYYLEDAVDNAEKLTDLSNRRWQTPQSTLAQHDGALLKGAALS
jgi:hypothetical protein